MSTTRYYQTNSPDDSTEKQTREKKSRLFWNREADSGQSGKYWSLLESSPDSNIQQEARILSLAKPEDSANARLHTGKLPRGSSLLAIGTKLEHFEHLLQQPSSSSHPNVLFVSGGCPDAKTLLPQVLKAFPTIQWIHCRSAGIDFLASTDFANLCTDGNAKKGITVTNAKGQFSSVLAEYAMMACSYFAKDLPRLLRQQKVKNWEKYNVEEIRGKTMGIVGYGDIGRACAILAKAYGMRIIALRRNPAMSQEDPLCDEVYDNSSASLQKVFALSDYIVCAAPSTPETRRMINSDILTKARQNAVFINVGRGDVVDETALHKALSSSHPENSDINLLKGAALDVFAAEPLPKDSPLWDLPNILISPHNMDQTATFMHEATEFFVTENLPRFICGEELLNPVDPSLGY